jgi:hypothetical protein
MSNAPCSYPTQHAKAENAIHRTSLWPHQAGEQFQMNEIFTNQYGMPFDSLSINPESW